MPINNIAVDPGRHRQLSSDRVAEFAELYRRGGLVLPPITVAPLAPYPERDLYSPSYWPGYEICAPSYRPVNGYHEVYAPAYLLVDGYHRIAAASKAGLNEINFTFGSRI